MPHRSLPELHTAVKHLRPGAVMTVSSEEMKTLMGGNVACMHLVREIEGWEPAEDDLQGWRRNAAMVDPKVETPMGADEKLLRDALLAVTGERRKAYGNPENNFKLIATMWAAYLNHRRHAQLATTSFEVDITPGDHAVMMVLVKIARLAQTPGHRDSWLDIAGYAACGARC